MLIRRVQPCFCAGSYRLNLEEVNNRIQSIWMIDTLLERVGVYIFFSQGS